MKKRNYIIIAFAAAFILFFGVNQIQSFAMNNDNSLGQFFVDGEVITAADLNSLLERIIDLENNNSETEEISEPVELFEDFCKMDFFLKKATLSDGNETVIPIYSNTNNARMVVIPLENGATYHIKINNSGEEKTNRMRICTYSESFSDLMIAPLGSESKISSLDPKKVSTSFEIIYFDDGTGADASSSYEGTFINTNNAKTLIMMVAWGSDPSLVDVSVTTEKRYLSSEILIGKDNLDEELSEAINGKAIQNGSEDAVYCEQELITMTNVLTANMSRENEATENIMEIAYNFWKHRDEFIYCSGTALDQPWNYWSYTGYVDSANTGNTVTAENSGYKRIDCSTFVRYVVNGIDYYSTPYYNALELTEVEQGGLDGGDEVESDDSTVCRTGKMYVRPNKKLILEAKNSNYSFSKIFGYNAEGEVIQTLDTTKTGTVFTPETGVIYLRAEMKVTSASDYTLASEGTPAAILKYLRIREDERLEINAKCPLSGYRNANQMCKWFDENGFSVEYNKYIYSDNDFKVGSIIFWGKTTSTSTYKNITHTSIYIGSGYIMHVSAPYGLVGGEAILIEPIEQVAERYTVPMAGISSPLYHNAEE